MLRAGAARPHVLTVTMPGGTAVRLAAEQELRRRGWPRAMTPADADVLLIAGGSAAHFAEVLDAAWRAMPAPRARAHAALPDEVAAALEAGRARLGDRSEQALAAPAAGTSRDPYQNGDDAVGGQEPVGRDRGYDGRETGGRRPGTMGGAAHDGHDTGGMDMGRGTHHGHEAGGGGADDMGGMDMSGGAHHGHDMSGMDMGGMEMPGGLPMADRGADRDGLRLDQLHVPLGPVLPDWPAGLVVHLTLQGDVVQHAEAQILGPGGGGSFWDEPWRRAAAGEPVTTGEAVRRCAASYLDSLGRFLGVAGWDDAATVARRLRDDALAGVPGSRLRPAARRAVRRVARSRTLAWLTRGLGVLLPDDAAAAGVRGPALRAAGDVTARYRRWCAELAEAVGALEDGSPLGAAGPEPARGPLGDTHSPSAGLLAALPSLLDGAELAAARLIIASLDPDLDELAVPANSGHDH
jgi:hypothetical protein